MRDRHSRHDFADPREDEDGDSDGRLQVQNTTEEQYSAFSPTPFSNLSFSFGPKRRRPPVPDFDQQPRTASGKRIFGRPFVTAGWIVILLATVVCVAEIGLLVLLIHI
ncbi:hypothetical protein PM082_019552 [Marasmius tenuissimus]|nr:hypothetical protein PM082_019832 [Marasmius tenuissimus]KAJ8075224.1 hypothetical protein PM082_019552 [Marasmius tenuissimus]